MALQNRDDSAGPKRRLIHEQGYFAADTDLAFLTLLFKTLRFFLYPIIAISR